MGIQSPLGYALFLEELGFPATLYYPMAQPNEHTQARSPFGGISAVIAPDTGTGKRKSAMWIIVAAIVLFVIAVGAYSALNAIGDPLRTLPIFPTEKYFANPDSIAGSPFKADLRVDADLGWRTGTGRLMAFTVMNEGSQTRLAVLIPAKIADAVFDKNQAYRVELVVEEGGLIRAKSFKKL